jgi:hypothetical protein
MMGDLSTCPPRELAKALLRTDSYRGWIPDPAIPLSEVVKAIRCGSVGMCGGWPGGYDAHVRGTHIEIERSQGAQHRLPIRFTIHEIVQEMRAEAKRRIRGEPEQTSLWEEATA